MLDIKYLLVGLTWFACASAANAGGTPAAARLALDISRPGEITVLNGARARRLKISHGVNGYEVNCAKTMALVWGKPIVLNESNPQDSLLTIVSLRRLEDLGSVGFSKNIFDALFLNDGLHASVESDVEVVVNLGVAAVLSTSESAATLQRAGAESCADFKGKSYRRFKE